MYFPLHLQKQLQDVHAKARRAAFEHYIRKGRVPPDLAELVEATRTVPNFLAKYSPDQPRVPAGNPDGGQWTSGGGDGGSDGGNQPSQVVQRIPPIIDQEIVPEATPTEPLPGMPGGRPLPTNPDDLLNQGYEETTRPEAGAAGHRTFKNPDTGDELRFDEGKPGESGYRGQDHYHRINPDKGGPKYLDRNGNPVPKNSRPSHLLPREIS